MMVRKLEVFGEALAALGADIAKSAAAQDMEAQENWNKLLTMLKVAQTLGLGEQAFEALYNAGDKVVQKKAIWYRRQKRLIKTALELNIDITDMTMREAEEALTQAREDSKTDAQKKADALRMLERSMKGAVGVAKDRDEVLRTLLGTHDRKRVKQQRAH